MKSLLLRPPRRATGLSWRANSASASIGHKNLMGPFPSAYHCAEVELGWYEYWQQRGLFRPQKARVRQTTTTTTPPTPERFSLLLPPPNVTGHLHLGHALTATLQDVLVRWHRMLGHETVWVPGSDHAGIATQTVVEKALWARRRQTRHQLGRERFVDEVRRWRDQKGDVIFRQLAVMGASLDWDRTYFTMDKSHCRAVTEAFLCLHDKGLIYRDHKYLVNWSCSLRSAISDIEVDHVQLEKEAGLKVPGYEKPVQFGLIYDIGYRLADDPDEQVVVSTTRPETMLGDVGVAVNPGDPRHAHLVGKQLVHPFRAGRLLPIVADDFVSPSLGTGAVKVTPGHDQNDYDIGQRHGLEPVSVLDEQGAMVSRDDARFHGVPRFAARRLVLDALSDLGQFHGSRDHAMHVPVCSRSGDVVEKMIKPQWFLACKSLAERALEMAESKELKFTPESPYQGLWKHWLENEKTHDWCISRQLWWGHRIPAFCLRMNNGASSPAAQNDPSAEHWIVAEDLARAEAKRAEFYPDLADAPPLEQDEDVLDTWFSSAILPFAALGWPEKTPDLAKHYPLNLMETGHDILFFWVARMVMLGHELTGRLPFNDVFLHGTICDSHGRKMSKSIGNVIDPMDVIYGKTLQQMEATVNESHANGTLSDDEREKSVQSFRSDYPDGLHAYGADALRFGLCYYDLKNKQINLDPAIIRTSSLFCNKLWQLSRFYSMKHAQLGATGAAAPRQLGTSAADRWILSRCAQTVKESNEHLANKDFHLLVKALRRFLYTNLCDVYVECVKPSLTVGSGDVDCDRNSSQASLVTLHHCLVTGLKLLHPVMPFITEELYQRLPDPLSSSSSSSSGKAESIMIEAYPEWQEWGQHFDADLNENMDVALEIITSVRVTKQTYGLGRKHRPPVSVVAPSASAAFGLEPLAPLVSQLAQAGDVRVASSVASASASSASCSTSSVQGSSEADKYLVSVDLAGLLDFGRELENIEKKVKKAEKAAAKIRALQTKEWYADLAETKRRWNENKLADLADTLASLQKEREALEQQRDMCERERS